jgi:hypothetical protein
VFMCGSRKSDYNVYTHQIVILSAWIHHGIIIGKVIMR